MPTATESLLRSFNTIKDGYREDADYSGSTVRGSIDSVIWHFEQALPKIQEEADKNVLGKKYRIDYLVKMSKEQMRAKDSKVNPNWITTFSDFNSAEEAELHAKRNKKLKEFRWLHGKILKYRLVEISDKILREVS